MNPDNMLIYFNRGFVLMDDVFPEQGQGSHVDYQEQYNNLLKIEEVVRVISSEHKQKRVLEIIMYTVVELTGAERGFLILK